MKAVEGRSREKAIASGKLRVLQKAAFKWPTAETWKLLFGCALIYRCKETDSLRLAGCRGQFQYGEFRRGETKNPLVRWK